MNRFLCPLAAAPCFFSLRRWVEIFPHTFAIKFCCLSLNQTFNIYVNTKPQDNHRCFTPMLDGGSKSRRKKTTASARRTKRLSVYAVPMLDGAKPSPRP